MTTTTRDQRMRAIALVFGDMFASAFEPPHGGTDVSVWIETGVDALGDLPGSIKRAAAMLASHDADVARAAAAEREACAMECIEESAGWVSGPDPTTQIRICARAAEMCAERIRARSK